MAEKPQFYQEYKWAEKIASTEVQLAQVISRLETYKADLEAIKAEVDADAGSTADMITLANQGNGLVNNTNYTGFINFITNALA